MADTQLVREFFYLRHVVSVRFIDDVDGLPSDYPVRVGRHSRESPPNTAPRVGTEDDDEITTTGRVSGSGSYRILGWDP